MCAYVCVCVFVCVCVRRISVRRTSVGKERLVRNGQNTSTRSNHVTVSAIMWHILEYIDAMN